MDAFLRRHGWKIGVHALLLILGAVNIYPFLWMVGTSVKERSEATANASSLVPVLKYELAQHAGPATPPPDANPRQRKVLADLATGDARSRDYARTFIPARIDAATYARQNGLFAVTATAAAPAATSAVPALPTATAGKAATAAAAAKPAGRSYDLVLATAELDALVASGHLITDRVQTENYSYVLRDLRFALHTAVSLAITACVVFIVVLMATMVGYAIARVRFPGKFFVICLLLIGAVAPRDAVFVPIFMMFQTLGLFDGLWGMVLWMGGAGVGHAFICAGYFLTLPKEVEEAARVDGAGPFATFFDIALPMARPIVMTVGLFAFLGAWNEFLVPMLCTMSRPELQPLAVAVYSFRSASPDAWHLTNAAAAIMVLPVIVIFLFMQRQIVNSIAVGAVKG